MLLAAPALLYSFHSSESDRLAGASGLHKVGYHGDDATAKPRLVERAASGSALAVSQGIYSATGSGV